MKKIISCLLCISVIGTISGCSKTTKVKQKTFTYEYGKKVSTKASTYLDGDKDDLKDYKIKLTAIDQYQEVLGVNPPAGVYKGEAIKGKKKLKFKVKVKDTKKPIINVKKVKLPVGSDISSLNNILTNKIYDKVGKQKINTQFVISNTNKINFKKAGTYSVDVTATDINKNETKKSITVNIFDMNGEYVCTSPYQNDRKLKYNSKKSTVTYINYIDKKSKIGKDITKVGTKKYADKMRDEVKKDRPGVIYTIKEGKNQYILEQTDTKKKFSKKQFTDMMEGDLTKCEIKE